MRIGLSLLCLFSCYITASHAQTDVDALRYSMPSVQGTARNIALGNTMGTIGADISAVSTNPAGLAKFSSAEFTLSPAVSINKSSSLFLGNTSSYNKTKFQLTNLGVVIAGKSTGTSETKKWNGIRFGFALTRTANFNSKYYFSGYNTKNSLLNAYYEKLNDRSYITDSTDAADNYPFDASIAYQLGLITIDSLGNTYTATNNGNMQQSFVVEKSGGINELALGIGSMYKDKIMVGVSVGVPILNYTERIKLTEEDIRDSAYDLNSFINETYLKTTGVGFNLKVGIIGMPIPNLRLSLAFQTPGILFMKDAYQTYMEADYESQQVIFTGQSPEGGSKYKFIQPWKMTAGIGYIHKYGLLAAEYELSDAANARFRFNLNEVNARAYENYVNNLIKGKYGLLHTVRAGVEFKYKQVRFRGGIQYRTSPFKSAAAPSEIKTSALTYSAGLGYRGNHFFADIAYVQTNTKEMYLPYQLSTESWKPVPAAILSTKKPAIVVTVGYKL